MIRLPTAVDPVNEIRSTFGDSVSSSPTRWSDDVTTLSTPGGKSVCSATSRPSRVAFHGVSGAGLRITVLPVARACPSLFSVTSRGKFHGTMAPTTPTGSFQICRVLRRAAAVDDRGEVGPPGELVDQLDRVAQRAVERDVELVGVGGHARAAHLEDELLAQLLALLLERLLQLGRGTRLRSSRLVDQSVSSKARRAASMARCISALERVGHLADDLLGGRVDVVERLARVGLHELAVDQHPSLRGSAAAVMPIPCPVPRSLTEWKPDYQKVSSA